MSRRAPRSHPIRITSPLPTKRSIEDDIMVPEGIIDITSALEARSRRAPFGRIGIGRRDIRGGGRVREMPDGDGRGGPLHGVDAAAVGVEVCAVGGGEGVVDGAADAFGLVGGVEVAACVDDF